MGGTMGYPKMAGRNIEQSIYKWMIWGYPHGLETHIWSCWTSFWEHIGTWEHLDGFYIVSYVVYKVFFSMENMGKQYENLLNFRGASFSPNMTLKM